MSKLYIETHGRGDTHIVLIHGWAMHGGVFAPLTAALAERATVHVVDLPGHGHSRDSDLPLDAADCARAIAEATPPAIWLGWSLGGLVALAGEIGRASCRERGWSGRGAGSVSTQRTRRARGTP